MIYYYWVEYILGRLKENPSFIRNLIRFNPIIYIGVIEALIEKNLFSKYYCEIVFRDIKNNKHILNYHCPIYKWTLREALQLIQENIDQDSCNYYEKNCKEFRDYFVNNWIKIVK